MIDDENHFEPLRVPRSRYFSLPPVGESRTVARVGGAVKMIVHNRCSVSGCYFVGVGTSPEEAAEKLKNHVCPTLAFRDTHHGGPSVYVQAWDELDDAVDAMLEKRPFLTSRGEISGDTLSGYVRGLTFTLAILLRLYYTSATEVGREAMARRKMRTGAIPYRLTLGYNSWPGLREDDAPPPALNYIDPASPAAVEAAARDRKTEKKATPRKTTPRRTRMPAGVTAADAATIKRIIQDGAIPKDELAAMYSITVRQLENITGM